MNREEEDQRSVSSEFSRIEIEEGGDDQQSVDKNSSMTDGFVDQMRECVAKEIGKRELVTKVELQAVEIELHKMGEKLCDKMDNMKHCLDFGLLERMISEKMAPLQQEIADNKQKEEGEMQKLRKQLAELLNETQKTANPPKTMSCEQSQQQENPKNNDGIADKCVHKNQWQHSGPRLQLSDCVFVRYGYNKEKAWHTARTKHPFPAASSVDCPRLCYFEVKITKKTNEHWLRVGLCDDKFALSGKGVGECMNSFATDAVGDIGCDGRWEWNMEWRRFGQGDVIGCGVEITKCRAEQRQLFFTKNGKLCGHPILLPASTNGVELFPAVSLYFIGDEIEANFGHKEFKYNLAEHKSRG